MSESLGRVLEAASLPAPGEAVDPAFARRMELPELWQYGMVVPHLAQAMRALEAAGCPPFARLLAVMPGWIEWGRRRTYALRVAFSHVANREFELIAPIRGSDFHSSCVDPARLATLHHVAYLEPDLEARERRFNGAGFATAVRSRMGIPGVFTASTLYLDCREATGLFIEFLDFRLLGRSVRPSPDLFRAIGRVQGLTRRRAARLSVQVPGPGVPV